MHDSILRIYNYATIDNQVKLHVQIHLVKSIRL